MLKIGNLIRKPAWQYAQNILCVRLDSLGDVLMTTPALRALKAHHSQRKITLLTSHAGSKVTPLIPEVDETIIYAAPWMKATQPHPSADTDFEMIDRLRESNFDAAVIFTVFSQNPLPAAMLTYMAGIPQRLAYCRENPYHLLTDWFLEPDSFGKADIQHEVRRQLELVRSIGASVDDERLSMQVPLLVFDTVRELLKDIGLDVNKKWLVIHPGASAPSRRYPPEKYAKVARDLASMYGFQILFTGGADEVDLVESIRWVMGEESFSLAGKLPLPEFSALLFLAPLLLTNNTGPVHIAAAVQTPVVDLYALTNPQHTPWKVPHRVLSQDVPCKFCYKSICPLEHHNCLRLVAPEAVLDAVLDLLQEQRYFLPEQVAIPEHA